MRNSWGYLFLLLFTISCGARIKIRSQSSAAADASSSESGSTASTSTHATSTAAFAGSTSTSNYAVWDAANSYFELANPAVNSSAELVSGIIDATATEQWNTLAWVPNRPSLKNLPDNAGSESAYANGNAVMTSNRLLFHMSQSSWNGTAAEVVDSSGQNNHGVSVSGATTISAGRFGRGASFDGINDSISIADSAGLDLTTAMSLELWMKPSSAQTTTSTKIQTLLDKGAYRIDLNDSGKIQFELRNAAAASWVQSLSNPSGTDINRLMEFNGRLYVFTYGGGGLSDVYYCEPGVDNICQNSEWLASFDDGGGGGSLWTAAAHEGKFYIETHDAGYDNTVLKVCDPGVDGVCTQADWSNVWTVPATSYESIEAMISFKGRLYISTGWDTGAGDVLVCNPSAGGSATSCDHDSDWDSDLGTGGIQPSYNGNSDAAVNLAEYNGRLYVAHWSMSAGMGDIIVCNPGANDLCDIGEWSVAYDASENITGDLVVYNGFLYASFGDAGGMGHVRYCNPALAGASTEICDHASDWVLAQTNLTQSAMAMTVHQGRLYLGRGPTGGNGDIYVCEPTTAGLANACDNASDWTKILEDTSETELTGASTVLTMFSYRGNLYAGLAGGSSREDLVVYTTGSAIAGTTASWNATAWNHIAATYDGSTMRLYVNGAEESNMATAFTPATNLLPILLGKSYGSRSSEIASAQAFAGSMDEVAAYGRVLTATEIADRYKRGALRMQFQVRSCDDAACSGESFIGPDGTASTYYSEELNLGLGLPSLNLLLVPDNRYFQYKVFFDSDSSSFSPELKSVSIDSF